jgi:octaprenyl-diphosphate synthase
VIGNRPKVEEEALESFGLNLGIAFQLIDDVLDYSAKQVELGKTIGDDFHDGKITLPVILAFRRGDETERAFWRCALEDLEQRDDDLERAIGLLDRHGALRDTIARAGHYGAIARDALGIFPDGLRRRFPRSHRFLDRAGALRTAGSADAPTITGQAGLQ